MMSLLQFLFIPAIMFLVLAPGIDAVIRSRNNNFLLFLIPVLIDVVYLLAAHFLSGPVVNDFHDHAYEGSIGAFGLMGLPALAIFVFRARANIWPALWLAAVGLLVWCVVMFAGLNVMTDGRAVI